MNSFSWIPFYIELANAVLELKDNSKKLVEVLKSSLNKAELSEEKIKDFEQIDPFTFYSYFNRHLTLENQQIILECIKNELGIKAPIPKDFNGVPSANNQLAWFAGGNDRSKQDREILWRLFKSAIDYADNNNNKEALENYYDHAVKMKNVKQAKLTSALFWIRPNKFISLDSNNVNELKKEGYIAEDKKFNSKEYLEFCNELLNKGVDFPSFSDQAYKNGDDCKEQNSSGSQTQMSNNIKVDKNIILYGPPGTGKTYNTIAYSVAICSGVGVNKVMLELKNNPDNVISKYKKMKDNGQIEFITFHQSYGYEDFIEGIKPNVDGNSQGGNIQYSIESGIFKRFCNKADRKGNFDELYDTLLNEISNEPDGQMQIETQNGTVFKVSENSKHNLSLFTGKEFNENGTLTKERIYGFHKGTKETSFWKTYYNGILDYIQKKVGKIEDGTDDKNYVFIIDEINRGNISKVFGELITLIEETKRKGVKEGTSVKLPLSGEEFSVPNNVYIIGTMNTADRSIALLDTALRRRFKFIEMMPNYDILEGIEIKGLKIKDVAKKINDRIEVLFDREHTIGHAYYLKLNNNKTVEGLADLFKNHIIPLLQEYFFDDYEKIRYILGDNGKDKKYQFIQRKDVKFNELFNENIEKNNDDGLTDDDLKVKYNINDNAFNEIESYKGI